MQITECLYPSRPADALGRQHRCRRERVNSMAYYKPKFLISINNKGKAIEASAIHCINPKSRDQMRVAGYARKDASIFEVYSKSMAQL